MLFQLEFDHGDTTEICKLVWDEGPQFESIENGGRISDKPTEIIIRTRLAGDIVLFKEPN